MRAYLLRAAHILSHLILLTLLISFQTSLWPLLLGPFPPQFWILPFVYLGIYFPLHHALLYVFGLAFLLSFASSAQPFIFLAPLGALTLGLSYFRSRVFWPGPTYYALLVFLSCLLWPALLWTSSTIYDPSPLVFPSPWAWSFQVLLTPWLAFPLYRVLDTLDTWTLPEGSLREAGISTR